LFQTLSLFLEGLESSGEAVLEIIPVGHAAGDDFELASKSAFDFDQQALLFPHERRGLLAIRGERLTDSLQPGSAHLAAFVH
jgi:hypothetical protein